MLRFISIVCFYFRVWFFLRNFHLVQLKLICDIVVLEQYGVKTEDGIEFGLAFFFRCRRSQRVTIVETASKIDHFHTKKMKMCVFFSHQIIQQH